MSLNTTIKSKSFYHKSYCAHHDFLFCSHTGIEDKRKEEIEREETISTIPESNAVSGHALTKEVADMILTKLEENKKETEEVITSFGGKMKEEAANAVKNAASNLDSHYKRAIKETKDVLDRIKKAHKVTGDDKKFLKRNLTLYCVTSNSSFVLRTMKKCIAKHLNCMTLESFLASLPQSEMLGTVSEMKKCLLSFCNHWRCPILISFHFHRFLQTPRGDTSLFTAPVSPRPPKNSQPFWTKTSIPCTSDLTGSPRTSGR